MERQLASKRDARRTLCACLLGLLCALLVSVDLAPVPTKAVEALWPHATGAVYIALEVLCSFLGREDSLLVVAFGLLLTRPAATVYLGRDADRSRMRGASTWVVPALFALAMVFGRSFDVAGSAELVCGGISEGIKAALSFIGWLLLARIGIVYLFRLLDRARTTADAEPTGRGTRPSPASRAGRAAAFVFDRHPFALPAALLALAWLPCLIGYAPGLFMWDTGTQILQWFGHPNNASSYLNLIDPGTTILTQHHPPLTTALIGSCVQLGMALWGSENAGAFLFTCLQFTAVICSYAHAHAALARIGCPRAARMAAFAFVLVVPVFSNYAVLITKDVLFAAALLLFVTQLVLLVRAQRTEGAAFGGRDIALLAASALGITLTRNGALAIAAAGIVPAALVCLRGSRRSEARTGGRRGLRIALGTLGAAVAVNVALTGIVYPALGITPGSRREVLSIPFQQTARYVQEHEGELSQEERDAIGAVLDIDAIGEAYNPNKSDAVKNTFNEDATAEDLAAYFRVWASEFARDPVCYLEATAANYYAYFYAGHASSWSYTSDFSREVMDWEMLTPYFSFSAPDHPVVRALDGLCTLWRTAFQKLPLTTLTMQAALYCWGLIALTAYAAHTRQGRMGVVLAPMWAVLLITLIGPCNAATYFRYAYPLAVLAPFAFAYAVSGACTPGMAPADRLCPQGPQVPDATAPDAA